MQTMWDIEFRPNIIENFVFSNEQHKENITKYINDNNIPHMIFEGHRGTGKTTMAYLLKNALNISDMDFLIINGSDENGVNTIRTKIKNFVSVIPESVFKIVFIDEADYLSAEAQASLRHILEAYAENARFIFTCNKVNKLIPELRSRCVEFNFSVLPKEDILERLLTILTEKNIKIKSIEDLESHVDAHYPDMRKIILSVQQSSQQKKLEKFSGNDTNDEVFLNVVNFIEVENWEQARTYISANFTKDLYDSAYKFLYEYLHMLNKFKDEQKWKSGIVIIADHLYKHYFVADPEINFVACIIRLCGV